MNNIGQFLIWLALLSISASSVGYAVLNMKKESGAARNVGRLGFVAFAAVVTIASMLLMHFILNHEFIYSYVARYSSRDLPLGYLISSFWAGQEGSFLLWVLIASWLGLFLVFKAGDAEPQIMLIYNLNNIFLALLLIKQSPFRMLPIAQPDGQGLNMLLQDPWMVIHPPVVFLGYAAYTIPFAFAIAGLWRREYDAWIKPALPWTVFAFVSLGAGIIIGGYWSYKVLGWGGYWGWDPVENASLLPWLAGTALMHGMILQQTQKRLRKTNLVLAAFSFILVIYCTFLTRSGVLADFSVHSFLDLGITGWLVVFMLAFIAIFLGFAVYRAKDIPQTKREGIRFFSREFGLIAAMILLVCSALVTGLGTSAPLITRVLEKASKVSTEFYVNTNLPLALLMLVLLSVVPLMTWGRNELRNVAAKARWAGVGAVVALVVTLLNGYPDMGAPLLSLGVFLLSILAGAVTAMNLLLVVKLARKRIRLSSGAVAHLGLGLMFLGIVASSAYDQSEKVKLPQGEPNEALGYELKLNQPRLSEFRKGVRLLLPLTINKGDTSFTAQPDIYSERRRGNGQPQRFVHPYIGRGFVYDLYISPVDFDPGEKPRPENEIVLEKDKPFALQEYTLTFTGFDVTGMMGHQQGRREMSVGATIEVAYQDNPPETIKPVLLIGQQRTPQKAVRLPGPQEAYVNIAGIDAGSKTVTLHYEGLGPLEKPEAPSLPSMIAEVSIKPGMTVLWLGCFLLLLGGCIGVYRRNGK